MDMRNLLRHIMSNNDMITPSITENILQCRISPLTDRMDMHNHRCLTTSRVRIDPSRWVGQAHCSMLLQTAQPTQFQITMVDKLMTRKTTTRWAVAKSPEPKKHILDNREVDQAKGPLVKKVMEIPGRIVTATASALER